MIFDNDFYNVFGFYVGVQDIAILLTMMTSASLTACLTFNSDNRIYKLLAIKVRKQKIIKALNGGV